MARIKAFRAHLYNSKFHDQLPSLIAPPYDVIKTEERDAMVRENPYHSVQLCLVDDSHSAESYQKTAELYQRWKAEGVLTQSEEPALYLIEDRFLVEGQEKHRLGFVALMEVSPFEEKKVFPHEYTLAGPKKDRLELLKAMGAEASQIFMAYKDPSLLFEKIFEKHSKQTPEADFTDGSGIQRRLWKLSDESDVKAIENLIAETPLLIADGHHRYETALHFAKEDGTPRSQFVQCYFTNTASPGFEIRPIHRVTSLPEGMSPADFLHRLANDFEVQEMKNQNFDKDLLSADDIRMICAFSHQSSYYLLSRPKTSDREAALFDLQQKVFEKIFDWDVSQISKGRIDFEHTQMAFMKTLNQRPQGVGFYLPATDLDVVMKVVQDGERMPQKSTFFYPKLASGLVIYELGQA